MFLESCLARGKTTATITLKSKAPNIAGSTVMIDAVKNIDVIKRFPINTVIFFAAFAPASNSFLFLESFFANADKLFNIISIALIPRIAKCDHIAAHTIFLIDLLNAVASSLMLFAAPLALSKVFLFFCNVFAIVNTEFLPTNTSLNFPMILFLIILLSFLPIFANDDIISGAELISLMILFKSFSLIFKSSLAFLKIFPINFIF